MSASLINRFQRGDIPSDHPIGPKWSHCVIVGCSFSGIFAASFLSNHFDKVTVFERDSLDFEFPNSEYSPKSDGTLCVPPPRRGVPQSSQIHLCGAGGQSIIYDKLFPTLRSNLRENCGVPILDFFSQKEAFIFTEGNNLKLCEDGSQTLTITQSDRHFFEAALRAKMASEHKNIEFRFGVAKRVLLEKTEHSDALTAAGIVFKPNALKNETKSAAPTDTISTTEGPTDSEVTIKGDLIVDCSGRGRFSLKSLEESGIVIPQEELNPHLGYVTFFVKRNDDFSYKFFIVTCKPQEGLNEGIVITNIQGGITQVCVFGVAHMYPPNDSIESVISWSKVLPTDVPSKVLEKATLLSGFSVYRGATNCRIRPLEVTFPSNLILLGDSLTSFNPIYGQGISHSARQSDALDFELWTARLSFSSLSSISVPYFKKANAISEENWMGATCNDYQVDGVSYLYQNGSLKRSEPKLSKLESFLRWYFPKFVSLGHSDFNAAMDFIKLIQQVSGPEGIMRPAYLAKASLIGFNKWWGGK